jgi:hypothetical protein
MVGPLTPGQRVTVRLAAHEAQRLDELRGPLTRPAYLRRLLAEAEPGAEPRSWLDRIIAELEPAPPTPDAAEQP